MPVCCGGGWKEMGSKPLLDFQVHQLETSLDSPPKAFSSDYHINSRFCHHRQLSCSFFLTTSKLLWKQKLGLQNIINIVAQWWLWWKKTYNSNRKTVYFNCAILPWNALVILYRINVTQTCHWFGHGEDLYHSQPYLIFVTYTAYGICGEKFVMWRNFRFHGHESEIRNNQLIFTFPLQMQPWKMEMCTQVSTQCISYCFMLISLYHATIDYHYASPILIILYYHYYFSLPIIRGQRYIGQNLSKADILALVKLLTIL